MLIATKGGKPVGDEGSGKAGLNLRCMRQAVHDSPARLQTAPTDLDQSQDDDPAMPLEETVPGLG